MVFLEEYARDKIKHLVQDRRGLRFGFVGEAL
jgi:hypothetical protein